MSRDLSTEEWDAYAESRVPSGTPTNQSPSCHILQTSTWAELKCSFGWWATRVAARRKGQVVAGAQILFRPLPIGIGSIAYLPKGPLVDWNDLDQCRYVLSLCEEVARSGHAIFLKVEPDLPDTPETATLMERLGLQPSQQSVQPRRTLIVDLSVSEEELLARMTQKTRYNIRIAKRRGVTIRVATPETASVDLETFQNLIQTTGKRGRFGVHTAKYYQRAYELFHSKAQADLFLAEHRGISLAAIMVFTMSGRAWYFYGASSNDERHRMPTYALQWEAMRWAKERGCHSYDLWGVPDDDETQLETQFMDRRDGLWPVYRFKRGFGGRVTRSTGAWDKVCVPWAYKLYTHYLARPGS